MQGFLAHREEVQSFDQERENSQAAFFEEEAQWEIQRMSGLKKFLENRSHRTDSVRPEYSIQDQLRRVKQLEAYEELQMQTSRRSALKKKKSPEDLPESLEYGLNVERPRYDLKKRALYTGQSPYGKKKDKFGGFGSSDSSPSRNSSPPSFAPADNFGGMDSQPSFPPPPPIPDMDSFDSSQMPPPAFDENDFPPPPPPPPPPAFDEGEF